MPNVVAIKVRVRKRSKQCSAIIVVTKKIHKYKTYHSYTEF